MRAICFFILLIFAISNFGLTSCQRKAYCPAYEGLDPGRGNQNNPNNVKRKVNFKSKAAEERYNKKMIDKKRKEELKVTRNNRKKSTSLFPKYISKNISRQ
jgi:hypothetical protein